MCRHERDVLVLVLPGRSSLRPAPSCVIRVRAPIKSSGTDPVQPDSRPGSVHALRAFCLEEHGMKKAFALTIVLAFAASARAQPLAGLWDATVVVSAGRDAGTIEVPFRFEIAGSGANVKGSFFNGDDKV